jgi:hypothetical protein
MVARLQTEHDNVVDITGDGEQVSRELLFARKYVQDIDLFPELQVRLTRIFGPGVERDMLHQLVYWFRKPKMQNRWTAYKTFDEWREERGLNRKQVDKGRKALKADGVVQEAYGPYKKVHYRVNWIRLQRMLETGQRWPKDDLVEDHFDLSQDDTTIDPPRGDTHRLTPLRHTRPIDPLKEGTSDCPPLRGTDAIDPLKGHSPTQETTQESTSEENAREYFSGELALQAASDAKNGADAAPEMDKEKAAEKQWPGKAETASFGSQTKLDVGLVSEVKEILSEGKAAELLRRHREEGEDAVYTMSQVAHELGTHLSEDLRPHIREAMRQLEQDGAKPENARV